MGRATMRREGHRRSARATRSSGIAVTRPRAAARARRVRATATASARTSRSSATQNRGGKGIILIDASERNGPVVGIKLVKDGDEVMLITDRGQTLRTQVDEIRETGRNAQGVKIMSIADEERIVALERLAESTEVDGGGGESMPPPPDGGSIPPPPESLN